MKITQTLWTDNAKLPTKLQAGWLDVSFHLYSWALSYTCLSRFYPHIELSTDSLGAELLIDGLGLGYDVKILFDEFENPYAEDYWVLKKIFSYAQQDCPFLHIDSDVYMWADLIENKLDSTLVAQNLERNFPTYQSFLHLIKPTHGKVSDYYSINAGIIGGNNFTFFNEFWVYLENVISENMERFKGINANMFVEQMLIWDFSCKQGLSFDYVINVPVTIDKDYSLMCNLSYAPYTTKYVHLMGESKQNPTVCELVAQRLFIENPELYFKVKQLLGKLSQTSVLMYAHPTWYRTEVILGASKSDFIEIGSDINSKVEVVSGIVDNQTKAVLNEVFEYEKTKSEYFDKTVQSNLEDLWQKNAISLRNNLTLVIDFTKSNVKIRQRKELIKIETGWNWAEHCEFLLQIAEYDYRQNLKKEEHYFEVLLIPYLHTSLVREFLLDPLNMIILESFEEPITISKSLDIILQRIRQYGATEQSPQMYDILKERVLFYLHTGILEFVT